MSDQHGPTPALYMFDLKNLSDQFYSQAVFGTLMVYDAIYHIPQQIQYLHGRKWSKLHVIYFSVLISNWSALIMNAYSDDTAWASVSWCLFGSTLAVTLMTMFTSFAMKILLVLRIRAIWNKNFIVTLILYFITAAEVLAALSLMIFSVYSGSVSGVRAPLHGCYSRSSHLENIQYTLAITFYIVRAATTTIEILLTFIRFIMTYKTQMVFGDGIRSRISHMKTSTRLLYVFYRDGTLLFIPLLVHLILYVISDLTDISTTLGDILDYSSFFINSFIVRYRG